MPIKLISHSGCMLILVRIEQNDTPVRIVVVSCTFVGLQSKDIWSGASLDVERVGRLIKARHGIWSSSGSVLWYIGKSLRGK